MKIREEDHFHYAIENSSESFALFDADENLVVCNTNFRNNSAIEAAQLLPGRSFDEILTALADHGHVSGVDDQHHKKQWVEDRLAGFRARKGPIEYQLSDGRWRQVWHDGLPDGGTIVRSVDISERKRQDEALRRSEERFRDIAESVLDWIWETGPDLCFTWFSDRAEEVLRHPLEYFLDKPYEELSAPANDVEGWDKHLEDLRAHRTIKDFTFQRSFPDGSVRHLQISGKPVFGDDGSFQGYRGTGRDITAEVDAQKETVRVQERFLNAIDNLNDQVALYDSDMRLVNFNHAFQADFGGTTIPLAIGMTLDDILRTRMRHGRIPEGAKGKEEDWIAERIRRFRNPMGPWEFERDRQVFETREEKLPDGETMVIVSNITERKQTENALRESEERYALAAVGANDGIWDWNLKTGEAYRSPRWYEILGYEQDELGPHIPFGDYLHPDDKERVNEGHDGHLKKRIPYDMEYRLRHKSGEYIWVRVKGQAVWDENGEPIRMAGSISDITDLKRTELELNESEAQLRLVTDSIPMPVAYIDPGHIVRFANLPYAQWQGFSQDEIVGMHLRDVRGEKWFDANLVDTERTLSGETTSLEGSRPLHDGQEVFFRATRVPHFGTDREVLGYFIIIVDLTEHHEQEAQLRQSQKMEAVGQLTGGIAHEFNNLLMVIVGNLELSMKHVSDNTAQKFATSAINSAMKGAELTRQLLAFSRKQDLREEPVALDALVRDMRDLLQRTLGETVSVDAQTIDDIWPVLADRSLLESTLLNLSLNARDAMPKGGKIVITTSNQSVDAELVAKHLNIAPGDYVMLEVADTGSGIAPENLEHVFEPFFTTKDVGKGTGLGLSMILGFAEQSGGFVDIKSELGQGTKVRVFLPRSMEAVVALESEINVDAEVPSVTATVLVVEDDPDVREIVVGILSDLGCNIIEAEDGKAALFQIDNCQDIDVVFTDVVLPGGLSGPDIIDKARRRIPDVKVILTSGYPDGEIGGWAKEEHPWFLRKPYRRTELAELFNKVLQS